MEIVKHGNWPDDTSVPRYFICHDCKCEFVADGGEYEKEQDMKGRRHRNGFRAKCPECGANCFNTEMRAVSVKTTVNGISVLPERTISFMRDAKGMIHVY